VLLLLLLLLLLPLLPAAPHHVLLFSESAPPHLCLALVAHRYYT
jgi:hypothetical protein